MKLCIQTPLAMLLVSLAACEKTPQETVVPTTAGDPVGDVREADGVCGDAYDVVGAVDDAALTESIDGEAFTDSNPFGCALADRRQEVKFSFNTDTTDPSSNCKYALTYTDSAGNSFSGSQVLSCSQPDLGFTATATPDAEDPSCRGLEPIVEDPQIQLKTKNCGQDED